MSRARLFGIVGVAVVLLAVISIGVYMLLPHGQEQEDMPTGPIESQEVNDDNDSSENTWNRGDYSQSTSSTIATNIGDLNEPDEEDLPDDNENPRAYNAQETLARFYEQQVPGDLGKQNEGDLESLVLSQIDENTARESVSSFLNGFYRYDSDNLKTGAYSSSFAGYVAQDANTKTGSCEMLYVHMNRSWQTALSSYPNAFSNLTQIENIGSPYVSNITHADTISIPFTIYVDRNQGEPGTLDWQFVNTYKITGAVYIGNDYKILDIREQKIDTVNINIFGYTSELGNIIQ